ncbi:2-hydroxy-6-oxohepta-2,4-dienoate hydrolase [Campylobacter sp. MIT 99-7217]|uniref:alpha/beta fold hydrolase n=1 Tax=Campylobacter sp. MIT 99-7217 TaxID=535091 RepID=UPI00115B26B6|nr:alpha/beta hydrolase [Campylobacter sp. MIT 99-7217]TQR34630.1 2-hydroxy-6-oxohepta-2,4-dienoate hydrolase [Campylobacter sp. MIT 99-7217]
MAQTSINYKNENFTLSYELLNLDKKPILLILHGWGANKELMKTAFKDSFKEYKHLYIDLCGFGGSNAPLVLNSLDYAQILSSFLKEKDFSPELLMGHSFGGKICTILALEQEKSPKAIILLSSAGILWQKRLSIRLKIKLFKLLKGLGFSRFYKFFASKDAINLSPLMYETFKSVVGEDFCSYFARLKIKTLIFWGIDDKATPLKSGEKIHSLIKNSSFYALKGDHFFFLNKENIDFIDELTTRI